MSSLLILSKSPYESSYETVLRLALTLSKKGEKIGMMHIQNASIACTIREYMKHAIGSGLEVYVLGNDCEARGILKKIASGVKVVSYKDFVELLMNKFEKAISWS